MIVKLLVLKFSTLIRSDTKALKNVFGDQQTLLIFPFGILKYRVVRILYGMLAGLSLSK